jgi:hypothetical protein
MTPPSRRRQELIHGPVPASSAAERRQIIEAVVAALADRLTSWTRRTDGPPSATPSAGGVAWLETLTLDELQRFDRWPKERQLMALAPHVAGYDVVIGDARRSELGPRPRRPKTTDGTAKRKSAKHRR